MNSPSRLNMSMNSLNTTSHNAERISALAEKLNQIQVTLLILHFQMGLQNEKLSRLEKIDESLKDTGDRLIDFTEDSTSKFQAVKEQLNKLVNQIEQQNNTIDASYDEKMQYIANYEDVKLEAPVEIISVLGTPRMEYNVLSNFPMNSYK